MKKMLLGVALTGLLALSGCDYLPFGFTPVKEIVASPAQFEGKEVRVKGKVKDIVKVPLVGLHLYTKDNGSDGRRPDRAYLDDVDLHLYVLDDGSGEVTVMARGSLPAVNETVSLKGVVESIAIMGSESIGLHIKETKRF